MAELDRRSHMISFRLSEEAYAAVKDACGISGMRSPSELARRATEAWVNFGGSRSEALLARVWDLRELARSIRKPGDWPECLPKRPIAERSLETESNQPRCVASARWDPNPSKQTGLIK